MIKPILCYASELWEYAYNKRVESVHINFCKRYCLLNKHCIDTIALSKCGRLPICFTYYVKLYQILEIRLLRLNSPRYPKHCYNLLLQLEYAGRTTLATHLSHYQTTKF